MPYWNKRQPRGHYEQHHPLSRFIDHVRSHLRTMEIIDRYEKGEPVEDIKKTYEVAKNTILRKARDAGLPKRSKQLIPDDIKTAVIEDFKKGMPLKALRQKYAVSEAWISLQTTALGINRYRTGKRQKERQRIGAP